MDKELKYDNRINAYVYGDLVIDPDVFSEALDKYAQATYAGYGANDLTSEEYEAACAEVASLYTEGMQGVSKRD